MSDNTMREGKLWAFLRDSIHEAYKKLSTTGTSNEYHALLDSIASKVADDVDARFLQVAQSEQAVPVVGEPVAWMMPDGEIRHSCECTAGSFEVVYGFPLIHKPTHSIHATELERLREDAERYRWIRDPKSPADKVILFDRGAKGKGVFAFIALDECIDAAIAQEPKK